MSVSTRAARSSSLRPAVGALTAVATMRQATAAAVTSPKVRATALLSATDPAIIPPIPITQTTTFTVQPSNAGGPGNLATVLVNVGQAPQGFCAQYQNVLPTVTLNWGQQALAHSSAAGLLATGHENGVIRVWRVGPAGTLAPAESLLGELVGHAGPVWALHFVADGHRLLSGDSCTARMLSYWLSRPSTSSTWRAVLPVTSR